LRTNCRPRRASYRSECGAPCKFPRTSLRSLTLMQSQNTPTHTTTNSHDAPWSSAPSLRRDRQLWEGRKGNLCQDLSQRTRLWAFYRFVSLSIR
jgi:hypothetical protein